MATGGTKKQLRPKQSQRRPGKESNMKPKPIYDKPTTGHNSLNFKVALITGGDSGIGRAVAVLFAKEGADVAIVYHTSHDDAKETAAAVAKYNKKCLLIPGDISKQKFCQDAVKKTVKQFGRLDILVNNAAVQFEQKDIKDITPKQLESTFATNIFSMFWFAQAVMPHFHEGCCIINTASVTAYRGSKNLIDYSATKGAIVSFTRSLSANLVEKGIRVNAVAPGPIWTPLIPSSFSAAHTAAHGSNAPMQRAGEPAEVAPAYLFLASDDSSYITGQVIHPNGGEIVNS